MHHEDCDQLAREVLGHFRPTQRIGYSVGEFDGQWNHLANCVERWWKAYKTWEAQDTIQAAFTEQRLTVKGTSEMNLPVQAQTASPNATQRYGAQAVWSDTGTFGTPIVKTNASVLARLNPLVFRPDARTPSRKTELGYHDLSALLLNPRAPISSQQYKGRGGIQPEQVYVFMPVSPAIDQAVFQNINTLAKAQRLQHSEFYDRVRQIRSTMTRLKLLAEHDMAVAFVKVGTSAETKLPKFKYTLLAETDVSFRDEQSGLVPQGTFKNKLTEPRIEDALKKADPPLGPQPGDLIRLANVLKGQLKALLNKEFDPLTLRRQVDALWTDRKFESALASLKPKPSPEVVARCRELILGNAGGKTQQNYRTTPGIYEARQRAAINFESLVLGEMMRYAEVTIAYRSHDGQGPNEFPKFARFDGTNWVVGTVSAQNVWTARPDRESFADLPR